MTVYVVDHAIFRPGEDIAISVCVGRWGSALKWVQEMYTGCIQHGGAPDIWGDASTPCIGTKVLRLFQTRLPRSARCRHPSQSA